MRNSGLARTGTARNGVIAAASALLTIQLSLAASGSAKSGRSTQSQQASSPSAVAPLSQKAKEWKLLFDGKTTQGWRGFRKKDFPSRCWLVEDGALHRRSPTEISREACGDVITAGEYQNFQLELEWRLSPGGNSGVKYLISEERPSSWEHVAGQYQIEEWKRDRIPGFETIIAEAKPEMWFYAPMGFELQLVDDDRHPDARKGAKRITGALYDLVAPSQRPAKPAGEYNRAGILVQGDHVEHWINGLRVLEFEIGSKPLQDLIAKSKFKDLEGFGTVRRGHIDLQDHGDEVWFRNIRIRELPSRSRRGWNGDPL